MPSPDGNKTGAHMDTNVLSALRSRASKLRVRGGSFLGLLAAAALLAPCAAQATPFIVHMVEQGGNVVATGSGAFDLTGLTSNGTITPPYAAEFIPSSGYAVGFAINGPGANVGQLDIYNKFGSSITGPTAFGTGPGSEILAGSSGDAFLFVYAQPSAIMQLGVPSGYASDTNFSGSATWANATFASLDLVPGTYVWTWGAGPDQSFTLDISAKSVPSVPEPAALGMFGFGLLLLSGFTILRRRASLPT